VDEVLVFGHKNPDTDSVCGAIAVAHLKQELGINAKPYILSEINKETEFVLKKFNVEKPPFLNDVKVKIKDVLYHRDYYMNENASIYKTYNFMNNSGITGIPLVNNDKKFIGYVSLKEIASEMIVNFTNRIKCNFSNIVDTLQSNKYLKFDDVIEGNIVSVTYETNTFKEKIDLNDESILIIGDRRDIIDYAIERHVKLIVLVGDIPLSEEYERKLNASKINVVCTSFSSFKVARLITLANEIKSIKRQENAICLDRMDYLTDFIDISNETKHTNYPIVSKNGNCHGMLRLIDTNEFNKYKVILVDHNEKKQSVLGLDEAEILEIIDHHNMSGINTSMPINFRNMSVGSVCTIIYFLYKENNILIPKDIAALLMSGIISDTLLLKSPTTTNYDKEVLHKLSLLSGINIDRYGMELLKSGINNDGLSFKDIIYKDFKNYNSNGKKIGIGQVMTTDFSEYEKDINEYVRVLDEISNNDYDVMALFVTNILTNNSYVIYNSNSANIIKNAYDLNEIYQGYMLENVLSRKKQILPNLINAVEKMWYIL